MPTSLKFRSSMVSSNFIKKAFLVNSFLTMSSVISAYCIRYNISAIISKEAESKNIKSYLVFNCSKRKPNFFDKISSGALAEIEPAGIKSNLSEVVFSIISLIRPSPT